MKVEIFLERLKKHQNVLKKYKVKSIAFFGSYLKGQQHKRSDLDVLVKFSRTISLFDFIRLGFELEKILGIKVDLMTPRGLRSRIKKQILKEVVWIKM
jgi:hypothetical protein